MSYIGSNVAPVAESTVIRLIVKLKNTTTVNVYIARNIMFVKQRSGTYSSVTVS